MNWHFWFCFPFTNQWEMYSSIMKISHWLVCFLFLTDILIGYAFKYFFCVICFESPRSIFIILIGWYSFEDDDYLFRLFILPSEFCDIFSIEYLNRIGKWCSCENIPFIWWLFVVVLLGEFLDGKEHKLWRKLSNSPIYRECWV